MQRVTTLLSAALIISTAGQAAAAVCGEREAISERLGQQYHEKSESIGLTSDGNLLEIYRSDQGTWTVLLVTPKGVACVVAAGEAWQQKDPLASWPEA
jgi:hypothetical protein